MRPTTETALRATKRAHWRFHVRRLTTELSAAEYTHSVSRAPQSCSNRSRMYSRSRNA